MAVSPVFAGVQQPQQQKPQTLEDKLKKEAEKKKKEDESKPKPKEGEALSPAATVAVLSGRWQAPKGKASEDSSSDSPSSGGSLNATA